MPPKPIRVRVKKIVMDPQQRCLVILGTPKRDVPIWIGAAEGQAIALKLEGKTMPRPMTHDLFVNALSQTGWGIEKLVISDLRETTFYGELHLRSGSKRTVLDCRPSDGIALALRTKAPLYIAPHIFDLVSAPSPSSPSP
jgi:bifunctional DNase/RNase